MYCDVRGESGYRRQCTLRVREDEGLDDQAAFRFRKCVLLSTSECSYDYEPQGMGNRRLAERLHDLSV